MHREADKEIGMVFVELEFGRRRPVFLHCPEDFRDAGRATLGDFKFLEEIADAAVAVAPRDGFALAELVKPHRAVGAGIVDDDNFLGADADLDGFALVVPSIFGLS